MAQSDLVKVAVGAAIGAAIATALVVTLRGGGSPWSTHVTLSETNGTCTLAKENKVWGKASQDLTWVIDNHCKSDQTVVVGNFRTAAGSSGQNNCSAEGPQYPFDSGNRSETVRAEGGRKIKLKVKGSGNLPSGTLKYYFDICLGSTIADPELMIER
jgi:hypothetical protein